MSTEHTVLTLIL